MEAPLKYVGSPSYLNLYSVGCTWKILVDLINDNHMFSGTTPTLVRYTIIGVRAIKMQISLLTLTFRLSRCIFLFWRLSPINFRVFV